MLQLISFQNLILVVYLKNKPQSLNLFCFVYLTNTICKSRYILNFSVAEKLEDKQHARNRFHPNDDHCWIG